MRALALVVLVVPWAGPAWGAVTEFTSHTQWAAVVNNNFTTIGFAGYPDGMFVTNQYSNLGVTFLDGDDNIFVNAGSFLNDGVGLGGNASTTLDFDAPLNWIAVDHPGFVRFKLYSDGQLIFSNQFSSGSGVGWFYGVVSTVPFDRAVIDNPFAPVVAFDDLHFGPPIPAPALALLALSMVIPATRRRRV